MLECEIGSPIVDYGHKLASTYLRPLQVLKVCAVERDALADDALYPGRARSLLVPPWLTGGSRVGRTGSTRKGVQAMQSWSATWRPSCYCKRRGAVMTREQAIGTVGMRAMLSGLWARCSGDCRRAGGMADTDRGLGGAPGRSDRSHACAAGRLARVSDATISGSSVRPGSYLLCLLQRLLEASPHAAYPAIVTNQSGGRPFRRTSALLAALE